MIDIRNIIERALSGTLIQPTVMTSLAEMSDPKRRRNISQLLGIAAATPQEPQKTGDESPAPSPEKGTDHPEGNE